MMKKIFVLILSFVLIFGLAACGNNNSDRTTDPEPIETPKESLSETIPESSSIASDGESEGLAGEAEGENAGESDGESGDELAKTGSGKTLVVYYSATGNTKEAADYIAAAMGADVFELEPVNAYTDDDLDYNDDNSRVVREHENPDEQDIELAASTVENWDGYDTVFIGFPIWWHIAAWPVNGFVKANDFTGKTVIPFCTSASSDFGDSGELLEEMAGTGNWLEGQRFSSGVSESDVQEWINTLGL